MPVIGHVANNGHFIRHIQARSERFPPRGCGCCSCDVPIPSGRRLSGFLSRLPASPLIAVKSRFLLHEQFKSPPLVVCEKHSACTSIPAGIKKRHNLFLGLWRSMQKGTLSFDNPLLLGYSLVTCLPAVLKCIDFTGFLLVFLCQRS